VVASKRVQGVKLSRVPSGVMASSSRPVQAGVASSCSGPGAGQTPSRPGRGIPCRHVTRPDVAPGPADLGARVDRQELPRPVFAEKPEAAEDPETARIRSALLAGVSAETSVTEKFGGKVASGFAAFDGPSAAFGGSPCVAEDDPDSDLYAESRDADTVIGYIRAHS
jgi:hypothetical protein